MEYSKLGSSGLDVSRICLGCMSYGEPDRGYPPWSLSEADSAPFIERALELGINFFDTANIYSAGASEEILGRVLASRANRDEVVIATKLFAPMHDGRNAMGLSRKAVMTEVDHSLRRLGTDHIDLYQIHRWDDSTPIEETMEALDDVVRSGKVRYLGASSMWAWQFSKAQYVAEMNGWTPFVSMQNHYNLLHREEEREMIPLCVDRGVGVIPYSPLARGLLTRDWDETTDRSSSDASAARRYGNDDRPVAERVAAIADERTISRAQVALAWLLSRPAVTAPIIGATAPHHLDDAVGALDVDLTPDEVARLEELYRPRAATGFT